MQEGVCRTEGCPANGVWVYIPGSILECESCWKPLSEIQTAPPLKQADPNAIPDPRNLLRGP